MKLDKFVETSLNDIINGINRSVEANKGDSSGARVNDFRQEVQFEIGVLLEDGKEEISVNPGSYNNYQPVSNIKFSVPLIFKFK